MIKKYERAAPNSCWNKAAEEELLFVLLGRDPAAPAAIEAWCRERIRLGLSSENDEKIDKARTIAEAMVGGARQVLVKDSGLVDPSAL
jgi:hypothetical protein